MGRRRCTHNKKTTSNKRKNENNKDYGPTKKGFFTNENLMEGGNNFNSLPVTTKNLMGGGNNNFNSLPVTTKNLIDVNKIYNSIGIGNINTTENHLHKLPLAPLNSSYMGVDKMHNSFSGGNSKYFIEGGNKMKKPILNPSIKLYPSENSKEIYLKKQKIFEDYCSKYHLLENEEGYIQYFMHLIYNKNYAPTTIGQIYGILNRRFRVNFNSSLQSFNRLTIFLKDFCKYYLCKKAEVFTNEEIKIILQQNSFSDVYIDSIIFCFGYFGFLRGCQIPTLQFENITINEEEIIIKIDNVKTKKNENSFIINSISAVKKIKDYDSLFKISEKKGLFLRNVKNGKIILDSTITIYNVRQSTINLALKLFKKENYKKYTSHSMRR